MPNRAILFGCDFPPDKYSAICQRSDVPMLYSVYDQTDHEEMISFLKIVTEPLADKFKAEGYVTFEQIAAGKPVKIDNSFFDESRRANVG